MKNVHIWIEGETEEQKDISDFFAPTHSNINDSFSHIWNIPETFKVIVTLHNIFFINTPLSRVIFSAMLATSRQLHPIRWQLKTAPI